LTLAIVGAIWSLINHREWLVGPIVALAFAVKPQIAFAVPVLVVGMIVFGSLRKTLVSAALGALIIAAVLSPYVIAGTGRAALHNWISAPSVDSLKSINAANFWCIYQYAEKTVTGHLNEASDGKSFLGFTSCRLVGMAVYAFVTALILRKLWTRRSWLTLVSAVFLSYLAAFLIMTSMHERYIVPAAGLLAMIAIRDRRFLSFYILLAMTSVGNVLLVYLHPAQGAFGHFDKLLKGLMSLVNIGVFACAFRIFLSDRAESQSLSLVSGEPVAASED
jgi:hypothetical protein